MMPVPDYTIRELTRTDEAFLYEMLYHAIYVPPGGAPPLREVVRQPDLSRYVAGFGEPGDMGYSAIDCASTQPIAAAWLRLLTGENRGYGYVDDATPELTVAVLPVFRGQGIGTALLQQLLIAATERYHAVSLSVWRENPAYRLYETFGFEVVSQNEQDAVMIWRSQTNQRRVRAWMIS
jgi:ribosomal protein S18 acetylase RimI-like enzyme